MGRTLNILDNDQSTVTRVKFIDKDNDWYTIESSHAGYLKLVFNDGV